MTRQYDRRVARPYEIEVTKSTPEGPLPATVEPELYVVWGGTALVCHCIREFWLVPVVMLTARGEPVDQRRGFREWTAG
jgi:hypothetical protein